MESSSTPKNGIILDAKEWKTPLDFYAALLPAIGAPSWHGESIAAIDDSMIGGGINTLKPPYVVGCTIGRTCRPMWRKGWSTP